VRETSFPVTEATVSFLSGAGSKLQGNYIGTDITGTVALGNSNTGVVAGNGALIGGTTPEARNIIAANGGAGNVSLGEINSGVAATVQGNYIGTGRHRLRRPLVPTQRTALRFSLTVT
jgi:titin